MNELGKTVIKGKLRIVTPVHVGGAQEKHLQRGLDYISKEGKVYFLDEKKLIAHFGVVKYSDALSQGKLEQLCGSINIDEYVTKVVKNIAGEIGVEIKTNIKNTLSQKPIIPGTSFKGSLRSVFYNLLAAGDPPNRENEVFGQIYEDIFRYMIVSDVEFNESSYINTKTFNLQGGKEFKGGWKHRSNTSSQFNSEGFTFPHEVVRTDDIGDYSITLNQKALSLAIDEQKKIEERNKNGRDRRIPNILNINQYTDKIFKGSESDVLAIIQSYMSSYLQAEIDFFTKYETDQSGIIVDELNRLVALNQQAPLLRLGLGSGFHAMTGDTLHTTHDINGIGNRNRGLNDNQDSAKSRKIAFRGNGENLQLLPMGFVQLMTDEYYEQYFKAEFEAKKAFLIKNEIRQKEKVEADRAAFEVARIKAAEDTRIQAEKEEIAKQEALKPKMIEAIALKKVKWVDGIVVGQNGKMVQFKPFISGFEEKVYEISYSAGMPLDTVIQVMCMSPNGKMLQFQGSPKLKNG